jgi:hypothetical protein
MWGHLAGGVGSTIGIFFKLVLCFHGNVRLVVVLD